MENINTPIELRSWLEKLGQYTLSDDRSFLEKSQEILKGEKNLVKKVGEIVLGDGKPLEKERDLHLRAALNYQLIIKKDEWDDLCRLLPIDLTPPMSLKALDYVEKVQIFTQRVVDSVDEVAQKSMASKLISTRFLSAIDTVHKNTTNAIEKLKSSATDPVIGDKKIKDKEAQNLDAALKAHADYLNALSTLPLMVDSLLNTIGKRNGINFLPQQNAEVLASLTLSLNQAVLGDGYDGLKGIINTAVMVAMPQLPLSSVALQELADEFCPALDNLIKTNQAFEQAKKQVLPEDNLARKILLRTINVQFDSFSDFCQTTLLDPLNALGVFGRSGSFIAKGTELLQKYFDMQSFNPADLLNIFQPDQLEILENLFTPLRSDPDRMPSSVKTAMAYLSFYDLANKSGYSDELLKIFFKDYMIKNKVIIQDDDVEYTKYLAFKTEIEAIKDRDVKKSMHQTLDVQLSTLNFADAEKNKSFVDVLCIFNRLNHLDRQIQLFIESPTDFPLTTSEIVAILQELQLVNNAPEALKASLNPVIETILFKVEKAIFCPLVEGAIDNPVDAYKDYNKELKTIYAKLIDTQILSSLSSSDLKAIDTFFNKSGKYKDLNDTIFALRQQLGKEKENPLPFDPDLPLTTREITRDGIKATLTGAEIVLQALSVRLTELEKSCKSLISLSSDPSDLRTLCRNKIAYICEVRDSIDSLRKRILLEPDKLTTDIMAFTDPMTAFNQAFNQAASNPLSTMGNVVSGLLSFDLDVLNGTDNNFMSKLLQFGLNQTGLDENAAVRMYQAKNIFTRGLDEKAIPALMSLVGNPFSFENLVPRQEVLMDSMVTHLTNYAQTSESIRQWIPSLSSLTGFPFIDTIATQVMSTPRIKAFMKRNMNQSAAFLRDRLYPLIGIEIQRMVQEKALAIAENKKDTGPKDRDAFVFIYLQYCAIKQNNPKFKETDSTTLFDLILKDLLKDKKIEERKRIIAIFSSKFKALDESLEMDEKKSKQDMKKATEDEMQFLITHLDFNDQTNDKLIRYAIINNMLLNVQKASTQLTAQAASMMQQTTISSLSHLLEKLEKNPKSNPGLATVDAPEVDEKSVLIKEILPGLQLVKRNHLTELQKELLQSMPLVTHEIKGLTISLEREKKEPSFGRLNLFTQHDSYKNNRVAEVIRILGAVIGGPITLVLAWSGFVTSLAAFSTGASLGALLLGSLATMGIVPAIALGARLLWKIGVEINSNLDKFRSIRNNKAYSLPTKIFYSFGLALKCLGLGLAKTLFSDAIIKSIGIVKLKSKGIGLLSTIRNSVASFRNLFRRHPTEETVKNEESQLKILKQSMLELEQLVDQQINKPNQATYAAIIEAIVKIRPVMNATKTVLESSRMDGRKNDTRSVPEGLVSLSNLSNSFKKIEEFMASVETINKIEKYGITNASDSALNPLSPQSVKDMTPEHPLVNVASFVTHQEAKREEARVLALKEAAPEKAKALELMVSKEGVNVSNMLKGLMDNHQMKSLLHPDVQIDKALVLHQMHINSLRDAKRVINDAMETTNQIFLQAELASDQGILWNGDATRAAENAEASLEKMEKEFKKASTYAKQEADQIAMASLGDEEDLFSNAKALVDEIKAMNNIILDNVLEMMDESDADKEEIGSDFLSEQKDIEEQFSDILKLLRQTKSLDCDETTIGKDELNILNELRQKRLDDMVTELSSKASELNAYMETARKQIEEKQATNDNESEEELEEEENNSVSWFQRWVFGPSTSSNLSKHSMFADNSLKKTEPNEKTGHDIKKNKLS